MTNPPVIADHGSALTARPNLLRSRLLFLAWLIAGIAVYALCLHISEVSPARLVQGLPRLGKWLGRAWPLDFSEFPLLLRRAGETVAMATVGITFGACLAAPITLLAARNITPTVWLHYPARMLLNALRGIDAFVFALIFVAAVGLGPFAGVLGIAVHAAGSIAKLWGEAIENVERGPVEAVEMSGAGQLKVLLAAVLPDVGPALASILLYLWEFNVRASTVLGIVGAGGIGQDLKSAIDLLQFDRVVTILLIILAMVTVIDGLSALARRRLQ